MESENLLLGTKDFQSTSPQEVEWVTSPTKLDEFCRRSDESSVRSTLNVSMDVEHDILSSMQDASLVDEFSDDAESEHVDANYAFNVLGSVDKISSAVPHTKEAAGDIQHSMWTDMGIHDLFGIPLSYPLPVYSCLAPSTESVPVFAKSSLLRNSEATDANQAVKMVREVVEGKSKTLPIGLKLDMMALVSDLENGKYNLRRHSSTE